MVKKEAKKRAAAPARGSGASKKAVQTAEAKAKADAKTPAQKRAAAAGNLPVNSPEAKAQVSKAPPLPIARKAQTLHDLHIDMGNLEIRLTKSYAAIGEADEAIKQAKKKRDGLVADKEALVRELMDCVRDLRSGQGHLPLQPPASTGAPAQPVKAADVAVAQPPAAVKAPALTQVPVPALTPAVSKDAPKPPVAPPAPAGGPVDPKAKKDAHAA